MSLQKTAHFYNQKLRLSGMYHPWKKKLYLDQELIQMQGGALVIPRVEYLDANCHDIKYWFCDNTSCSWCYQIGNGFDSINIFLADPPWILINVSHKITELFVSINYLPAYGLGHEFVFRYQCVVDLVLFVDDSLCIFFILSICLRYSTSLTLIYHIVNKQSLCHSKLILLQKCHHYPPNLLLWFEVFLLIEQWFLANLQKITQLSPKS